MLATQVKVGFLATISEHVVLVFFVLHQYSGYQLLEPSCTSPSMILGACKFLKTG